MNQMPWLMGLPIVLIGVLTLGWYVGVIVLLYKIWQELRAIRVSRG